MHQPMIWEGGKLLGNLEKMLDSQDADERWNAQLMARAYKNPAKYVRLLKGEGFDSKVMLDYSGILLESLAELSKKRSFSDMNVGGERMGNLINELKEAVNDFPDSIEFAGTAYSHCYFPTTPEEDWGYQVSEWRSVFGKLFGRKALNKVKGFWLPEMGVPGYEDKLSRLVRTLSDFSYEWMILPLQSVEGYEQMTLQKRIDTASHPHLLRVGRFSMPVIFSIPTYYLDQQSGSSAGDVQRRVLDAGRNFGNAERPCLIVPASDGENGNVMMNEFFPDTFSNFFREKIGKEVSSMCVSDFLETYYAKNGQISPESEIKVKTLGSSWIGSHKFWTEGERRYRMILRIERLSKQFSNLKNSLGGGKMNADTKEKIREAKKALLLAETSCYVYWGTDFWYDQGEKMLSFASRKMESIY
jgi:hypothetical protein